VSTSRKRAKPSAIPVFLFRGFDMEAEIDRGNVRQLQLASGHMIEIA